MESVLDMIRELGYLLEPNWIHLGLVPEQALHYAAMDNAMFANINKDVDLIQIINHLS